MWNLKLARVHNLFHRLDDDDVFIYIYIYIQICECSDIQHNFYCIFWWFLKITGMARNSDFFCNSSLDHESVFLINSCIQVRYYNLYVG